MPASCAAISRSRRRQRAASRSLIDEYRLYLHPLVLGGGKPFFAEGVPLDLRFLGSETLPEGIVLLRYARLMS